MAAVTANPSLGVPPASSKSDPFVLLFDVKIFVGLYWLSFRVIVVFCYCISQKRENSNCRSQNKCAQRMIYLAAIL